MSEYLLFFAFVFSFSMTKSTSITVERTTSSLPTLVSSDIPANRSENNASSIDSRPFSELAKEKSSPSEVSDRQLSTENNRTQIPLEPSVFVSFEMKNLHLYKVCIPFIISSILFYFQLTSTHFLYIICFLSLFCSISLFFSLLYALTLFH